MIKLKLRSEITFHKKVRSKMMYFASIPFYCSAHTNRLEEHDDIELYICMEFQRCIHFVLEKRSSYDDMEIEMESADDKSLPWNQEVASLDSFLL